MLILPSLSQAKYCPPLSKKFSNSSLTKCKHPPINVLHTTGDMGEGEGHDIPSTYECHQLSLCTVIVIILRRKLEGRVCGAAKCGNDT